MNTVLLPITWADIQALPRGTRRDQLTYAYRTRTRKARTTAALTAAQVAQLHRDAETVRLHAVATYGNGATA